MVCEFKFTTFFLNLHDKKNEVFRIYLLVLQIEEREVRRCGCQQRRQNVAERVSPVFRRSVRRSTDQRSVDEVPFGGHKQQRLHHQVRSGDVSEANGGVRLICFI